MNMRRLLTLALFSLLASLAIAQQDPIYSQYLSNKLVLNPAYAGSREQLSVVLQGRRQWAGYAGAPSTEAVSLHFPTADLRHGFGMALVNDRWGRTQNTLISGSYAYRIPVGATGTFSLGIKAGIKSYKLRNANVALWDNGDDAFNAGVNYSRGLAVVAPGLYFQNERFYAGLSFSDLIPHKLNDPRYSTLQGKTVTHLYAMAGAALPLGESVKCKPSVLLRYATGAPLGADLTLAFAFKDRITAGATWRPGNAIAFLLQAYVTKAVQFGYSYDLGTNATRNFGSGSHELLLGFDLNFLQRDIPSPPVF